MERTRRTVPEMLLLAGISAVLYFVLDFPIRTTGAFAFPDCIGIKSFLPFSLGLFLGPAGAIGSAAGGLVTSLLVRTTPVACIAETVCVLLVGLGTWCLWFARERDGNVRLERAGDFTWYFVIVALLSLGASGVTAAIEGRDAFLPTLIGFAITGALVSSLANILIGGIFCLDPILPPWCRAHSDILVQLPPEAPSPDAVNEEIESVASEKKISRKRAFEIENCLEELYIRIRGNVPQADVHGRIDMGTTISMRLQYAGEKYDPFRAGASEDEVDLISLKLLRHRALRASYTYRGGENRIHIVV